MRTIEEVKGERRGGKALAELIEKLLESKKLLGEYNDPFQVLGEAGVRLQGGEGEWLDMTNDLWRDLSVEKQIQYARAYQEWYGKNLGENVEKELSGIKMRLIPPGKFVGGVSGTIENAFWIGKYEVTQAEWKRVMGESPSHFKGDKLPVEQVSWEESKNFCTKIGEKMRLPSEAEWEYACKGGTTTTYNFGNNDQQLGEYAWYWDNSMNTTHEVGTKKENAWGLYDMHGNVWEWCEDLFSSSASRRVVRGGCWGSRAGNYTSAYRTKNDPSFGSGSFGFRVARSFP